MSGVLEQLVASSRQRRIEPAPGQRLFAADRSLRARLQGKAQLSLLAEFKRSSPSLGRIAAGVTLPEQLHRYQQAGAAGVSVLTEPSRFGGSLGDLRAAVSATDLPLLRKDFLVRPEQVDESRAHGASCVLLIVRCLPGRLLDEMVAACREASVEMLVECHDLRELERALVFEDAMLGVNNRDLDTLAINRERFVQFAAEVPEHRVVVAESGYREPADLDALVGLADAVLIGSALMQGADVSGFSRRALPAGGRS